jgi:radical SAM superfamily enzyme YgiQ (UPF0313 family)
MATPRSLRVVIVKPSKYDEDGYVERFRRGFMPNSTMLHIRSMTPDSVDGAPIVVRAFDEYVENDLEYLSLLQQDRDSSTLVALVGVQSHQLHRALDLAAYARERGVENCIIGGPHAMTCDTTFFQNHGISFALGEAEALWPEILVDAMRGELSPVYGVEGRWQDELRSPVLLPPSGRDLRRYVVPMVGLYPARGCPYTCNFCSVIKIAGRQVRSQAIETTIASLRNAKTAGAQLVMFTSDNFNKYADARLLLKAMIDEQICLPFFVQCDAQIAHQGDLVDLLAEAGCFQMFVGVESFDRGTLLAAKKAQNHPDQYREIVRICRQRRITTHFSNIIGFPGEGEEDILDHLGSLRELAPDAASFYILTPIPGTEQYDDFLSQDLIREANLDRFDGTTCVWRHPRLEPEQLTDLLFRCCREFYGVGHVASRLLESLTTNRDFRFGAAVHAILGHALLSRIGALQRTHPMAGGIRRVRLDHVDRFLGLRRDRFGVDLAPLPSSLELSPADLAINGRAKLGAFPTPENPSSPQPVFRGH